MPPPVATTTCRGCELLGEHGAFERPKVRLAVPREDVGDGHVLALLDQLVDVDGRPVEPPGERPREGRLAGGHETDQVNLVGLHATSRSSVSKKPGYEIATASAPSIVDGPRRARAAMAKAIAMR